MTPFDGLPVQEVRRELAARKLDSDGDSKEVRWRLAQHRGVAISSPSANRQFTAQPQDTPFRTLHCK